MGMMYLNTAGSSVTPRRSKSPAGLTHLLGAARNLTGGYVLGDREHVYPDAIVGCRDAQQKEAGCWLLLQAGVQQALLETEQSGQAPCCGGMRAVLYKPQGMVFSGYA